MEGGDELLPDWYDSWKLDNGPHGDECDCLDCGEYIEEQLDIDLEDDDSGIFHEDY